MNNSSLQSTVAPADVPEITSLPPHGVFRRQGRYWTATWEGMAVRLKDNKGMRYLAELIQRPGTAIHVAELLAVANCQPELAAHAELQREGVERVRKAVSNRIKGRLAEIRLAHPALGQHLSQSIKTGTFCCYVPPAMIRWLV